MKSEVEGTELMIEAAFSSGVGSVRGGELTLRSRDDLESVSCRFYQSSGLTYE